jgi:hypothetical protein
MAGTWTDPKTWVPDVLSSGELNEQVRDNLNFLKTHIALGAAEELDIIAGAVAPTQAYGMLVGESGDDDLDSITGGNAGDIVILRPCGNIITLKDGTGNLVLGADIVLSNDGAHAMLICNDAGNWVKFQWA